MKDMAISALIIGATLLVLTAVAKRAGINLTAGG